jgi:hypothetical protein
MDVHAKEEVSEGVAAAGSLAEVAPHVGAMDYDESQMLPLDA